MTLLATLVSWFDSVLNAGPLCGCGHAVKGHKGQHDGRGFCGCGAFYPSGLPCRCYLTRDEALRSAMDAPKGAKP